MRGQLLAYALLIGAATGSMRAQAAPALGQNPAKIPIASFAAQPILSDPILSPNGHWIAALGRTGSTSALTIINADEPTAKPLEIPMGKAQLADINWAGERKVLLTVVGKGEIYGIELPILRLVSVDLDTQQVL